MKNFVQFPNRQTVWWSVAVLIAALVTLANSQCPWPRTPLHASLHSDCVCGYSNVRRLSVQCSPMTNFSQLLDVLNSPSVQRLPIDLLYINNATGLTTLAKNAFRKLDIQQIHLANTRLTNIEKGAFAGLENKLISLTLQGTGLREVPVSEIRTLRSLRSLDLSNNQISRIKTGTFKELGQLNTLRLAFNSELQLDKEAFIGAERSLKNLNLKGTGQKKVPDAIRNLTELAFLDLAQNKLEEVQPRIFANLHLLTALSLERNLIRSLHPNTFVGLNDSLSSLSLLNNLMIEFPQSALSKLNGLRVLDLGFNAIRYLPTNAFKSNELLTLLALDGNPLKSISLKTFAHLNSTLRGISIGGKFFECDCKVRWLAEWAMEYNLQVTSRDRNPQFCAKPVHLRNKPFTHIDLNDFVCPPLNSATSPPPVPKHKVPTSGPKVTKPTTTTTTTVAPKVMTTTVSTTSTSSISPTTRHSTSSLPLTSSTTTTTTTVASIESIQSGTSYVRLMTVEETVSNLKPSSTLPSNSMSELENTFSVSHQNDSSQPNSRTDEQETPQHKHRPALNPTNRSHQTNLNRPSLKVIDVVYRNNSIYLRWETFKSSSNGYQVVYRYFGSKVFHKSRPISGKITSHTLANHIAPNELVVICVINLDDSQSATLDEKGESAIPMEQCRELSTRELIVKKASNTHPTPSTSLSSFYPTLQRLNDIDKIVIGISAAVCVFIIVTVLVFSCCFYRSSSKDSPLRTLATNATFLSTKSLSPFAKSSFDHEWETISVYSTRSIPRARINGGHLTSHTPTQPPTISNAIRTPLSSGTGLYGTTQPMGRYFGSTLPIKSNGVRSAWLESYLHHYPSVNNLPAVSYGTTVTAPGGGSGVIHHPNDAQSEIYIRNLHSLGRLNKKNGIGDKIKGSSSASSNHLLQQNHCRQNKKSHKSRSKSSKSNLDLRTNISNGSGNRLLPSSSSNSYHSQNEYDSDWNTYGGSSNNTKQPNSSRIASRMNDNEVDIYVDQSYIKRFF